MKHSQFKHGIELGYPCISCGKSFVNQDQLRVHHIDDHKKLIKKHEDFQCLNCIKVIRTASGVKRHNEIYGEKCLKCSSERTSSTIHDAVYTIQMNQLNTQANVKFVISISCIILIYLNIWHCIIFKAWYLANVRDAITKLKTLLT